MTHPLIPKDQFLMKFKDILLITTTLIGIWAFFSGFVGKSVALESKVNQLECETKEHNEKYIPILENHEKAITILQEQNRMIISYLDKIERSVRK